jgi:hypothetical protein
MRAGLQIFVAIGVLAIPVGASGLVSATLLATEPWLDANAVGTHQLAGILTGLLLVALAGFASAVLFALRKTPTPSRATIKAMTGLAMIGVIAALWTAYLGGGLRHSELHGITSQEGPSAPHSRLYQGAPAGRPQKWSLSREHRPSLQASRPLLRESDSPGEKIASPTRVLGSFVWLALHTFDNRETCGAQGRNTSAGSWKRKSRLTGAPKSSST